MHTFRKAAVVGGVLAVSFLAAAAAADGQTLQASVSANGYAVMDLSSHKIVAGKNTNSAFSIASVTKLMNAVVTRESVPPQSQITLNKNILKPAGYSPALYLNLTVSSENLLKASLIQSTNDAANALSYFVGKTQFVALMNKKAKDLGMSNTTYVDPHGLSLSNRSSPADIAKLVAYVQANHPDLLDITKTQGFQLPDPTGKLLTFKNQNVFTGMSEFMGGKTGYLPEAKNSIASVFQINGKPFAIIILGTSKLGADMKNIVNGLKALSI